MKNIPTPSKGKNKALINIYTHYHWITHKVYYNFVPIFSLTLLDGIEITIII